MGPLQRGVGMPYVKLDPFTHVTYRDRDVKREVEEVSIWADAVLHDIEFQLIKEGVRRCNYLYIDPVNPKELEYVYKYGLKLKVIASVKKFSGFAHTHEAPTGPSDTWYFAAACVTEEDAERMAKAYVEGDHVTQGLMLGYPEDDVQFFNRWWGKHLDLVYPAAVETGMGPDGIVVFDPVLNVALRYTGMRVIPFFPHSFRCESARRFADVVLKLLRERDREMTDRLLSILAKPFRFSQVNGIIQVDVYEDRDFRKWLFSVVTSGYSDEEYVFRAVPA